MMRKFILFFLLLSGCTSLGNTLSTLRRDIAHGARAASVSVNNSVDGVCLPVSGMMVCTSKRKPKTHGCGNDLECKGQRVCVEHICVNPEQKELVFKEE